jgi:molybdopterin adenylyltransferase
VSDAGFATAVLTISSSKARGEGEDESGPALAGFAERLGAEVVGAEVIDDDLDLIAERLRYWCDEGGCALVLTTGGTGFSADDVTPEAMRAASREHTPMWMTSRGVAGTRGRSLIVNFPGNPPAIEQAGAALERAIPHALGLLSGERH